MIGDVRRTGRWMGRDRNLDVKRAVTTNAVTTWALLLCCMSSKVQRTTGENRKLSELTDSNESRIGHHLGCTTRISGSRRVTEVSEVTEIDDETGAVLVEDIFVYQPGTANKKGRYIHTGYIPTFIDTLLDKGGITLDMFF